MEFMELVARHGVWDLWIASAFRGRLGVNHRLLGFSSGIHFAEKYHTPNTIIQIYSNGAVGCTRCAVQALTKLQTILRYAMSPDIVCHVPFRNTESTVCTRNHPHFDDVRLLCIQRRLP
jgi:hypothetical protein